MKKTTSPLLFFFVSFLFFGCPQNCPPDEKVGDFDLKTETLSYVPYLGDEKIVFKNSVGDSLIFESTEGKVIQRNRLCVKVTCTEQKIKGESSCEYIAAESHSLLFRDVDQTLLLDILIGTDMNAPESQDFYSFFRLGLSSDLSISSAGKITEVHFNGTFDSDATVINDFLDEKDEVIINGITFTDILAFEQNPVKYYYQKEIGLVGFITPDDSYHFDHIE